MKKVTINSYLRRIKGKLIRVKGHFRSYPDPMYGFWKEQLSPSEFKQMRLGKMSKSLSEPGEGYFYTHPSKVKKEKVIARGPAAPYTEKKKRSLYEETLLDQYEAAKAADDKEAMAAIQANARMSGINLSSLFTHRILKGQQVRSYLMHHPKH